MVPHMGVERSRVWREVKALGAELERLARAVGSLVRSRVAIAVDWNAWWGVEQDSRPGRSNYAATVAKFNRYFFERNSAVDFVHPGAELGGYALVVAPALDLLVKGDAADLEKFVERGRVFLTTYFSGIVDEDERVVLGAYPAYLRRMLGLTVDEGSPMVEGATDGVRFGTERRTVSCSHWCDVVHLEGAPALAPYARFFSVGAAVTVKACGAGAAYCVGKQLGEAERVRVLDGARSRAEVASVVGGKRGPKHVEVTPREKAARSVCFCSTTARRRRGWRCRRGGQGMDLLSGDIVKGSVMLLPLGARVVALA